MSRTNRLDAKRPDQWLIDQTTFYPWAVKAAEGLKLAERTPAEVRDLARWLALQPFEQYSPGFASRLFTAGLK